MSTIGYTELKEQKLCKMCKEREKDWDGDDPECAFSSGKFSENNWNCATVNAIREFVYEGQELPYYINYQYCEDYKYAIINILDMSIDNYDSPLWIDNSPLALWIAWYKSRGNTEAMWLLFNDLPPRVPTEKECLKIIEFLRTNKIGNEK